MSLSKKVADQWLRKQAAPAMLRVVLQELENLQELSDNLTDVEDQVYQTFKMAKKLDPEVRSQFSALKKAREGYKQAQAVGKAVASILQQYPEDKTAIRAAKDAAVMIKRFEKHESDASKIISRLSKKALPPALKKMAASLARMLKARLNDPKKLTVKTWQQEAFDYSHGGKQEGVQYIVLLRVGTMGVGLSESSLRPGVFGVNIYERGFDVPGTRGQPTTAKKQVALFMERLKGNPILKGEEDRTKTREAQAQAVYRDIAAIWSRMYGRNNADSRDRIEPKGMGMTFEAKVLPHDSYYGPSEIDDALDEERGKLNKVLAPVFKTHKDAIKEIDIYSGEKGWLYLNVKMK